MKYKFILSSIVLSLCFSEQSLSSDDYTEESSISNTHGFTTNTADFTPTKEKWGLENNKPPLTTLPAKKNSCWSSLSSYMPSFKQSMIVGGIVSYTAYQYYLEPEKGMTSALSAVGSNFYAVMGGSYLAANLFTESIKKFGYEKWLLYAPTLLLSNTTIEIQSIIRRAEAKRQAWPPSLAKSYELVYSDSMDFNNSTVKCLDIFSRLPTIAKRFNYAEVRERAEAKLVTCNEETRVAILDFLAEVCIASNSNLPLKRKSIFFLGEAGTGKTRMAHLIAEVLEVYLHIINLSTIKHNDMFDQSKPEMLLSAFAPKDGSKNFYNNVILFDEVDKAICTTNERDQYDAQQMKSTLLKLQDEDTRVIESKYLHYHGVDIDFSSAILIFCGNDIPKDISFLTRLPTLKFEAISSELKKIIAIDRLQEQLTSFNSTICLTQEDRHVIDKIIETDTKFAGVRALRKVCDSYAFHKFKVATLGHSDIPFDVERHYKTFLTTEELDNEDKKTCSTNKLHAPSDNNATPGGLIPVEITTTPKKTKKRFFRFKKSSTEDDKSL